VHDVKFNLSTPKGVEIDSIYSTYISLLQDSTRIWVTSWASGRPITLRWKSWTPLHSINGAQKTLHILLFTFFTF